MVVRVVQNFVICNVLLAVVKLVAFDLKIRQPKFFWSRKILPKKGSRLTEFPHKVVRHFFLEPSEKSSLVEKICINVEHRFH